MARLINKIILHCSDTEEGKDFRAKDIKQWHTAKPPKGNGWKDIGYNYVIDIDGTVETGRNIDEIPAHCKGQNANSIGICYIGGKKNGKLKDTRNEAQKLSMYKLVKELMIKYHIDITSVYTHNFFDRSKTCPNFDVYQFRSEFTTWLAGPQEKPKNKIRCPKCGEYIDEELLRSI